MSVWPARLSVKVVSKLCFDFHLNFQVLWLTPLLESFTRKSDSVAAF